MCETDGCEGNGVRKHVSSDDIRFKNTFTSRTCLSCICFVVVAVVVALLLLLFKQTSSTANNYQICLELFFVQCKNVRRKQKNRNSTIHRRRLHVAIHEQSCICQLGAYKHMPNSFQPNRMNETKQYAPLCDQVFLFCFAFWCLPERYIHSKHFSATKSFYFLAFVIQETENGGEKQTNPHIHARTQSHRYEYLLGHIHIQHHIHTM